MAKTPKKKIHEIMENARSLGNGTMEIYVGFDSETEVEEAQKWMEGKHKVKNLEVGIRKAPYWEKEEK